MLLGIGFWRYLVLPGVGLVLGLLAVRYGREKGWLAVRVRAYAPGRCVAVLFLLGVVAFGGLTLARYLTWHSFVHDLGSYDQKIWMVALLTDWWEAVRSQIRSQWNEGVAGGLVHASTCAATARKLLGQGGLDQFFPEYSRRLLR